MTRFAGDAFNNIRSTDLGPWLYEEEITPDEFFRYQRQQQAIRDVDNAAFKRKYDARADAERTKRRFGFNPPESEELMELNSRLNAVKRWIRNTSVPLSEPYAPSGYEAVDPKAVYLNLASDDFNNRAFELANKIEALNSQITQDELMHMVELELYHRRAAENEAQSFNNRMEQGLLNQPLADNRVAGKRRDDRRLRGIRFLREELQDADRDEALRMQRAADKYFGRNGKAKRRPFPFSPDNLPKNNRW